MGSSTRLARRLTRVDLVFALAAGILSMALYVRTLAPGLLPADSGEFQVLSALLGNTHPAGYPIYVLLGKLFTWLPVRDVAYRVNLLSAFMGAVAAAGGYAAGRLLGARRGPSLFGALALAGSPTFWSQAVIAEVYTPGAAFLVGVLVCVLAWEAYERSSMLFLAGLLGGLSLGVHLTVALAAPAVLIFLLCAGRKARRAWPAGLLGALLGTALVVGVWVLLEWHDPVPSYFNTTVVPGCSAWGLRPTDIDGPLERLLFNLSGRQFHSLMFADPRHVFPRLAAEYWRRLPSELSGWTIGLAGLGLVGLAVRSWRAALLLTLALAAQYIYTFNYDLWDLFVFHIPSYLLLAILAGVGLGWTGELLTLGLGRLVRRAGIAWGTEIALTLTALAVGVWPVFAPYRGMLRAGRPAFDTPAFDRYIATDYAMDQVPLEAEEFVRALEPRAMVFTDWYWIYPFYYAAFIEQGRTDLAFLETIPQIESSQLPDSTIQYVREQLAARPIYFFERRSELLQAGFALTSVRVGPRTIYRVQ